MANQTLGRLQCTKCDYDCRARDQLRIHMRQQHPEKKDDRSGYYHCVYCGREYTSISSRRRHYQTFHKDQLPPKESDCVDCVYFWLTVYLWLVSSSTYIMGTQHLRSAYGHNHFNTEHINNICVCLFT